MIHGCQGFIRQEQESEHMLRQTGHKHPIVLQEIQIHAYDPEEGWDDGTPKVMEMLTLERPAKSVQEY